MSQSWENYILQSIFNYLIGIIHELIQKLFLIRPMSLHMKILDAVTLKLDTPSLSQTFIKWDFLLNKKNPVWWLQFNHQSHMNLINCYRCSYCMVVQINLITLVEWELFTSYICHIYFRVWKLIEGFKHLILYVLRLK